MFYYKIYDDEEKINFIKTTIEERKIRQLLQEFEQAHQEYHNSELISFLKQRDPQAELIDVTTITY